MAYLTSELFKARVGGDTIYLQLVDDNGDETEDAGVVAFLLGQVDGILNSFATRGGYTVPLAAGDVSMVIPYLLDIANYKARSRGARIASDDDRKLYDDAMKFLKGIVTGEVKLPSYVPADTIFFLEVDTSQDPAEGCPYWSPEPLEGF